MQYSHVIWTTLNRSLPNDRSGSWNNLASIYNKYPSEYHLVDKSKLYCDYRCIERDSIEFSDVEAKFIESCIYELVVGDRVASLVMPVKVICFSSCVELLVKGSFIDSKQGLSRIKSRVSTLIQFKFSQRSACNWSKGFWAAEFTDKSLLFKDIKNSKICGIT